MAEGLRQGVGQPVWGLSREKALSASPQLGLGVGSPGPPGTAVPAKKTEFSSLPSSPPASLGTDSRPDFLPPAGEQRFPGRGALCHVGSCNPQGSLARPSLWPWHRWAAGWPLDTAEWPFSPISSPHMPSCVLGPGVAEMKDSRLRNSWCLVNGGRKERGREEERREREGPWKRSQPRRGDRQMIRDWIESDELPGGAWGDRLGV